MAGAWSVASGMMLRDWFRKREVQDERVEYEEELRTTEQYFLAEPMLLGYLASIDKAGYIRASGRARQTFKAFNPKDQSLGMLRYVKEEKTFRLNYDYITVVEDYYFEMRKGITKEKYQADKHNAMKIWLTTDVENNSYYLSFKKDKNYEKRVGEIVEKASNPNNIITIDIIEDKLEIIPYDEYAKGVKSGKYLYTFPIRG